MEKRYKAILYILIILLIISGGALFLWRDDLINNLNEKTGIAALEVIVPTDKTSDDTLDTSVLSEAKFTSLKNNVVNFDFDSVCKEGGKRITTVTVVESVDCACSHDTGSIICSKTMYKESSFILVV